MRPDTQALGDDGQVDMGDTAAGGDHCPAWRRSTVESAFFQRGSLGEMLADVADDGPKHGVGDGVEGDIGVRMADQTMVMGILTPPRVTWSPAN